MRALFFLFFILLIGCNHPSQQHNQGLVQDLFPNDSLENTKVVIAQPSYSPYDTLFLYPLLLLHKNKTQLLRKNQSDSLCEVLPEPHRSLLQQLKPSYQLKKLIANNQKMKLFCQGEVHSKSNKQQLLELLPVLQSSLIAYECFEFKIEQHYSWDDSSQAYSSNYQTLEILLDEWEPKQILHDFYAVNENFQWQGKFDSIAILNELIPGRIMSQIESESSYKPIFWQCDSCPTKAEFSNYFDSTLVTFPYKEGVNSKFRQCISYPTKGKEQKLLYFSSSEELNVHLTGRFCKGFMGLALFEQTKEAHWKLLHFNPAFDFMGTFQLPPELELIQNKKQPLFLAEDHVGGAGSPTYGSSHVYAYINNQFKKVLEVPVTYRWNHLSEWSCSIENSPSNKKFDDLIFTITGNIDDTDLDKYDHKVLAVLCPALSKVLTTKEPFKFKIELRFEWDKNTASFVREHEALKISPIEA